MLHCYPFIKRGTTSFIIGRISKMFGLKKIVIAQHERGLYLENKTIKKILKPGIYWIFDLFTNRQIEIYDLNTLEFDHYSRDVLIHEQQELCEQNFQLIELSDFQMGYVYQDDKLVEILTPSTRQLYWKGLYNIHIEKQDIRTDYEIKKDKLSLLVKLLGHDEIRNARNDMLVVEVPEQTQGLLFVDGVLTRTVKAGLHAFWKYHHNIKMNLVDLRLQSMDVSGQEILTKDKVSLRINLSAVYKITDPVLAHNHVARMSEYIYQELQFATREVIGTQLLDTILANKSDVNETIFTIVKAKLSKHGIELYSIGVKDIILPGDMKSILNQVVEIEKSSQANVIKRREETAATRSLLNTAKLMEENPILLRLKELESLEKITEKIDKLTVFGGLENVLQDIVKIGLKT